MPDPELMRSTPIQRQQGAQMPTAIDRGELQRLVRDEHAQLVEVLPQAEFEEEHLPGAINIPLKSLDAETARRLEREWPVIVYCHDYQ
jgi:rhodanese-related sulfurtransferase